MKIHKKRVIRSIEADKKRDKRGPVSLSLNLGLYSRFKTACEREGVPASQVVEKMMEEFLND